MSYLQGKSFVAPVKSVQSISKAKKDEIKELIRLACPVDERVSYECLINSVQSSYSSADEYFTNDALAKIIDEVKEEADYTLPIAEPEL